MYCNSIKIISAPPPSLYSEREVEVAFGEVSNEYFQVNFSSKKEWLFVNSFLYPTSTSLSLCVIKKFMLVAVFQVCIATQTRRDKEINLKVSVVSLDVAVIFLHTAEFYSRVAVSFED